MLTLNALKLFPLTQPKHNSFTSVIFLVKYCKFLTKKLGNFCFSTVSLTKFSIFC
jgi:hypothetical protein